MWTVKLAPDSRHGIKHMRSFTSKKAATKHTLDIRRALRGIGFEITSTGPRQWALFIEEKQLANGMVLPAEILYLNISWS